MVVEDSDLQRLIETHASRRLANLLFRERIISAKKITELTDSEVLQWYGSGQQTLKDLTKLKMRLRAWLPKPVRAEDTITEPVLQDSVSDSMDRVYLSISDFEAQIEDFVLFQTSVRLCNVLKSNKKLNVSDILSTEPESIIKWRNAGKGCVEAFALLKDQVSQIVECLKTYTREDINIMESNDDDEVMRAKLEVLTDVPLFIMNKFRKLGVNTALDLQRLTFPHLTRRSAGARSFVEIFGYIEDYAKTNGYSHSSFALTNSPVATWLSPAVAPSIFRRLSDESRNILISAGLEDPIELFDLTFVDLFALGLDRSDVGQALFADKNVLLRYLLDETQGAKGGPVPIPFRIVSSSPLYDACVYSLYASGHNHTERLKVIADATVFGDQPLEAIGEQLGVTRERVRQLKYVILRLFRKQMKSWEADEGAIPDDDDRRVVIDRFRHICQTRVEHTTKKVFATYNSDLPLEKALGLTIESEYLGHRYGSLRVISQDVQAPKRLLAKIPHLLNHLRNEAVALPTTSLTVFDLLPEELDVLLQLPYFTSTVEPSGVTFIALKTDYASVAGLSYRYLQYKGSPTHYTHIRNYAVQQGKVIESADLLRRKLQADDRFVSQGRTGRYALAEWGVNTDSIRTLIGRLVESFDGSIRLDRLYKEIEKIRPKLQEDSIYAIALLSYDVRNHTVYPLGTFEKQDKEPRALCLHRVAEVLMEDGVVTVKDLVIALQGEFTEVNIRQVLGKGPFNSVTMDNGRKLYELDQPAYDAITVQPATKSEYLVGKAEHYIRECGTCLLAEVVNELTALGMIRASAYKACSDERFEKYQGAEGKMWVRMAAVE